MISQNYLPIIAFMAGNKDNKEQNSAISAYLYRKQHESFNIPKKETKISIDYDKISKEFYKKLIVYLLLLVLGLDP